MKGLDIKALTKEELEKVQRYAEWLKGEGADVKWKGFGYGSNCNPEYYALIDNNVELFIIWNGNCRGGLSCYIKDEKIIKCTQNHYCSRHNHFEYFKPQAESLYRKWKLKQICGDLFEC